MARLSAGILLYRFRDGAIEVFLVHPGGPFWAKKDDGAWSIPKGEMEGQEDALTRARQEFREETGLVAEGAFLPLGEIKQAGGKTVIAWAFQGDCDPEKIASNTFSLEWPPRSGRRIQVPEIDRAGWFTIADARIRMLKGQRPFLDRLLEKAGE